MSLVLRATKSALSPGLTSSFLASGGAEPYLYEVLSGGAGGTINATTGLYTAPSVQDPDPKKQTDTIQVTDYDGVMTTLPILVANPLELFCEIIQKELGLSNGRVYLYNQKIDQPKDNGLYIAVGILNPKPFANTNKLLSNGDSEQSVNMLTQLSINIISRGPAARDRKEELIMALNSDYSQRQQEANSFSIGRISSSFVNLSEVDGAAIPNRFNITVNVTYFVKKTKPVDYFNDFADAEVTTEP